MGVRCLPACSATVWRARCLTNNEIVAVKILNLEAQMAPLEDIQHEAQTMKVCVLQDECWHRIPAVACCLPPVAQQLAAGLPLASSAVGKAIVQLVTRSSTVRWHRVSVLQLLIGDVLCRAAACCAVLSCAGLQARGCAGAVCVLCA